MTPHTKPPAHLIEAWVQRVRNLMKAQSIRAKATIMFDSGDAVLRVRAEYYRNLAARLERIADSQFNNAIRLECKQRCYVNRYSSHSSGAWEVETWQPYRQEEAVTWLFTKSMKVPTKNPRTFDSVLDRASRIARGKRNNDPNAGKANAELRAAFGDTKEVAQAIKKTQAIRATASGDIDYAHTLAEVYNQITGGENGHPDGRSNSRDTGR